MSKENRSSNIEMVSVPRHWAQETVNAGPGECVSRSDIALLSEALSLPVRQGKAVIVCDTCHGAGEVYAGSMTHYGYKQPPEPDMDTCPECGGEQRWYVASDTDRLVRELDSLPNGDSAASQSTLSDIVAQVSASNQVQTKPAAVLNLTIRYTTPNAMREKLLLWSKKSLNGSMVVTAKAQRIQVDAQDQRMARNKRPKR